MVSAIGSYDLYRAGASKYSANLCCANFGKATDSRLYTVSEVSVGWPLYLSNSVCFGVSNPTTKSVFFFVFHQKQTWIILCMFFDGQTFPFKISRNASGTQQQEEEQTKHGEKNKQKKVPFLFSIFSSLFQAKFSKNELYILNN